MNLLPQNNAKQPLTEKQEAFLDELFENIGNMKAAAKAGYAEGSSVWLKQRLADEIIERSKHMLAGHAVRAVNRRLQ